MAARQDGPGKRRGARTDSQGRKARKMHNHRKGTPHGQIDFEHGSVRVNLARAALPMLVAQILSLLYSIVDRIYIGRIPGVGTMALAGIGICFPIIILINAFTGLFSQGGAPLCAMERGRGNRDRAEFIMNSSFFLLMAGGIALMAVGYAAGRPLLKAFGASEEILGYAMRYLTIYLLGTIPFMISTGMNPYINAQGFATTGMMTVFLGAAANIILDPVFIFVFGLGIRGAAIATVISQFLSAGYVLLFLTGGTAELKLRVLRPSALEPALLADMIGLGTINFIMQFTNSCVAMVCNQTLSLYGGALAISLYTIISSVRQMLDVPLGALASGAEPMMSFSYGSGKYGRLKEVIRLFAAAGVVYTLAVWALIFITPASFIRLFTPDEELVRAAVPSLHIYYFAFVFQAFQYTAQHTFKALNRKKKAIFFSLFRKAIMVIPLTLILPRVGFGVTGVFMAEPISNVIGGMASFSTMYFTIYRKLGSGPEPGAGH